jgi:hypothetical protein
MNPLQSSWSDGKRTVEKIKGITALGCHTCWLSLIFEQIFKFIFKPLNNFFLSIARSF